jgi:DNA-binding protein Fis
MVRRLDRLVLEVVSEQTGGNQVQMSRLLGITRNTLRAKLRAVDEPATLPIDP